MVSFLPFVVYWEASEHASYVDMTCSSQFFGPVAKKE